MERQAQRARGTSRGRWRGRPSGTSRGRWRGRPSRTTREDGTSFSIIGTVEDTSELGEIYIGDSGDAFLVNSTVHIHVWSGSEWIDLGNISAPEGLLPGHRETLEQMVLRARRELTVRLVPLDQRGPAGEDGADGSMPVVMEMDVTVSSMKFYIDSILQADVTLYRGFTHTFEQSASSNSLIHLDCPLPAMGRIWDPVH